MVRCLCSRVLDVKCYNSVYDFYLCPKCGMFVTGSFFRYLEEFGFDLEDFYGRKC